MEFNLTTALVSVFLGASILFYCLLAGADFGAGILELFTDKKTYKEQRKIVNKAIGPVWEVNHIWLILALVISFNAFPNVVSQVSITFHIPITLLLIGIIFRGCAFAFRNYDVFKDRSHGYYDLAFSISSLLTPFSIGLVAGGIINGAIQSNPVSLMDAYVFSWLNPMALLMGLFVCSGFSYIAAIFIVGETDKTRLKAGFLRRAGQFYAATIILGVSLIGIGIYTQNPLFLKLSSHSLSLFLIILACLIFLPIRFFLNQKLLWVPRILVGLQLTLVGLGWAIIQFPYILPESPKTGYQGIKLIANDSTPEGVLINLLIALMIGGIVIFPALFYLVKKLKFH